MQTNNKQAGVTLLELMISLAILAIMVGLVAPNVQDILIKNRITSEINTLSALVQFTRNNAIDTQADTLLCPSANFSQCESNWALGKIVFADLNGDGQRNSDEPLLVANQAISTVHRLSGPNTPLRFQGNGTVSSPATLLLCHKNNKDNYARALIISLQGRVKMSRDTDDDGIHEDNTGKPLDCAA